MKLIVQIPCYNEEKTISRTLADIPKQIKGIDETEILIVDDGCSDKTVEVAKRNKVDHIVYNKCNKGLARSFLAGIDASLRLGADIIVNTDGDNQYCGQDIPKLISPILEGKADIVIGDRQNEKNAQLTFIKRKLQKYGSMVVRIISETNVPDSVSGFRAFSRSAAMQMNIVSPFSYTIETIIQAGKKHLSIQSVPIRTNPKTRESRLFRSIPEFILQSLATMIRMYTMFQPLRVFFYIGSFFILLGMIPSIRFLFNFIAGQGSGHIQSLILSAILFIIGFTVLMIGLVADVISFNRRLIEDILLRVKQIELDILKPDEKK
jgi:glycosyltransferase involved in cell wall biosynthesis